MAPERRSTSESSPEEPFLARLRGVSANADGADASTTPGPPAPRSGSLRGRRLIESDLSGEDLSGVDLSGADLSRADLTGAKLIGANLRGASLFAANLTEAELLRADLAGADLSECRAERSGFGGSDLTGASLFRASLKGSSFTRARLREADLRTADLRESRLREADLTHADLAQADLRGSDLERSNLLDATFEQTDLRGARLRGVSGYARTNWIGADIADVDFCGAYLVRRTIMDQNYLHEFRSKSRTNALLYRLWWATSDCGRSFVRWGLWTVFLVVAFAALFQLVAVDYGEHATPMSSLYYSVVTLTTLGYGDVVPASAAAQLLAMVEVTLGYLMLGGLLSIFATKMARRAD
jgi:uncharacterized protein YjbI with pentapeptide repeats